MGSINFYPGADYGLDSDYKNLFLGFEYRSNPSEFGLPSDPRTANQIKAVSDKISTGAKVIEVSGVQAEVLEAIPEQHLQEINRLKKLVGVDLTFHGPLVEPTGVQRGWDPSNRMQAERQMFSAVERAHKLDPKGNIIVTFHSSNGLPSPETKVINEKGEEEIKSFWVVDERNGDFQPITPKPDYYTGKPVLPKDEIEKRNKDVWYRTLQNVNFHAYSGSQIIEGALKSVQKEGEKSVEPKELLDLYSKYGKEEAEKDIKLLGPVGPIVRDKIQQISHGDIYLRDAYQELQNLFNQSYDAAKRSGRQEDLNTLDKFKESMKDKIKYIEEPQKIQEFANEIIRGVNVLRSISAPETLRPLKDFAIEQASKTFGNIAFQAYNKFKDNAPIISIENPPANVGLTRADEIKELIEASKKVFIENAAKEGISSDEAKRQADKLIGATWDLGHINMLRKYGFKTEQIVKESEIIEPYVKHIHLSDNFGYEHTELPMGMGNVPTKEHMKALKDYSKQLKKVIETGTWFQPFVKTPFSETLAAFGSPVYPLKMVPYWNRVLGSTGGYFAGYGQILPDVHFSTYGAGFSGLPPELGGTTAGRSRLAGAPTE